MPSGPKGNKYMNRHSAEAAERDAERAAAAKQRTKQAMEDAKWSVTDPKELKQLERRREEEMKAAKRAEKDEERQERRLELEREHTRAVPKKVASRQLQKDLLKAAAEFDKTRSTAAQPVAPSGHNKLVRQDSDTPLPNGNTNKAVGVQDSLYPTMNINEDDSRHTGQRAKVLYKEFYAKHIEAVRESHPGLRRSQYNDLLWEMWRVNPSNPFVEREEKRSRAMLEENRRWMEEGVADADENEAEETA